MADHAKRLPTLSELIGDGRRAEGFEEWLQAQMELQPATEDEAALLRLVIILGVATVEAARIEREQHGRDDVGTILHLARAAGIAVMAPVLCLANDQPGSSLALAQMLTEEFARAASQIAASHDHNIRREKRHG